MRRKKAPAKLAEIIHDGLGPLHTATSSKKRKAHTATDQLKEQLEEARQREEAIHYQLHLYEAADRNEEAGLVAVEQIQEIMTKGT